MSYLIDGHNLIPKIHGLSLQALDDEEELISLLQEFCRTARKTVEVYFDNAPAGHARSRKYGAVLAHFVRQGTTADQAIEARLLRLGRQAPNWTVISSDQRVQTAAKEAHAKTLSAEAFANLLLSARQNKSDQGQEPELSQDEIEEWLKLFKGNNSADQ
jgi:predicted RNA-binding protein with PIN domain